MAESISGNSTLEKSLNEIFTEGKKLYDEIQKTSLANNHLNLQMQLRKSIEHFEDATRIVSLTGMFSTNELIDEVATEHLQFLLLPFFLGQLNEKLNNERENVLSISEAYYKDFLKRCDDYELSIDKNSIKERVLEHPKSNESVSTSDEIAELVEMAKGRNYKILQYKKKKELDDQLKLVMHKINDASIDEETKRDYFLKYIQKSIIDSKDELESIALEKPILEMRKKVLSNPECIKQLKNSNKNTVKSSFKPVIITRDKEQKNVFGLGYPSLPVLTVRDFYEQRVKEGIFPNAEQVVEMNKKMSLQQDNLESAEQDDIEKAEKELLSEIDDADYIARQRAMDEYKDNVRRGDGNRYNRS